jgi:pyridoxine kinase
MASIGRALQVMHERYGIPHIVITSVSLPHPDHPVSSLSVVGSSMTTTPDGARRARAFKIVFPAIDCYFSGTGDMFAALMVVRMREAVHNHSSSSSSNSTGEGKGQGLMGRASWLSDDSVDALDLPLARAAEKVLASMHEVLTKTAERMDGVVAKARAEAEVVVDGEGVGTEEKAEAEKKRMHLLKSKAAELRLVRHLDSLRFPKVEFRATRL